MEPVRTGLRCLGRSLGEKGCELRAGPRQAWAGLNKGRGLVGLPPAVGRDLKCRGRLICVPTSGPEGYLGEMGGA